MTNNNSDKYHTNHKCEKWQKLTSPEDEEHGHYAINPNGTLEHVDISDCGRWDYPHLKFVFCPYCGVKLVE